MSSALQAQTKASVSDLVWNMAFLRQGKQDDREKRCFLTRSFLVACQVQVHHNVHIIHHVDKINKNVVGTCILPRREGPKAMTMVKTLSSSYKKEKKQ